MLVNDYVRDVSDLSKLQGFAKNIAKLLLGCSKQTVIYLEGELGAGKTTFVQMLLQELGYKEHVPSPSYSIVNTYNISGCQVAHADFYRLDSEESLSLIGWDIILDESKVILIEWPQILTDQPSFRIIFEFTVKGRTVSLCSNTQK